MIYRVYYEDYGDWSHFRYGDFESRYYADLAVAQLMQTHDHAWVEEVEDY